MIEVQRVETVHVSVPSLDRIEVSVTVYAEHSARITVACYDHAWTTCFMYMGRPWRDFIALAEVDYLANSLGGPVKMRKHEEAWLRRICEAVIEAVRSGVFAWTDVGSPTK